GQPGSTRTIPLLVSSLPHRQGGPGANPSSGVGITGVAVRAGLNVPEGAAPAEALVPSGPSSAYSSPAPPAPPPVLAAARRRRPGPAAASVTTTGSVSGQRLRLCAAGDTRPGPAAPPRPPGRGVRRTSARGAPSSAAPRGNSATRDTRPPRRPTSGA